MNYVMLENSLFLRHYYYPLYKYIIFPSHDDYLLYYFIYVKMTNIQKLNILPLFRTTCLIVVFRKSPFSLEIYQVGSYQILQLNAS